MVDYSLPTTVEINGTEYAINSDYRAILDICSAISDPDLSDWEKSVVVYEIFYPEFENMPKGDMEEAGKKAMWFINGGQEEYSNTRGSKKLVDWEQDFKIMIAPINNVAGREIRSDKYLHWWTFLSYYNEIDGMSYFAQVVQLRDKINRNEKLDKADKEFYKRNRKVVDFKNKYSAEEEKIFDKWVM